MRTKYSFLNISFGMLSQIILVILGFISRKIFVSTLGIETQGINADLTAIVTMLSLSELGIGTAIICNLYKPLAENNQEKIKSLLSLYSKAYKLIAIVVVVLGIAICPLLSRLIKEDVSKAYLIKVFMLFLFDVIISYLFAYKRSIIIADQKNFIIILIHTAISTLMNVAQISILLLTKNFVLYLIFKILFRFSENLVIVYIANKKYPFIKSKSIEPLDKPTKDNIIGNIKALALHYIGNYLITGTDMLIITKFLGAAVSGIYSNYFLITVTLRETFAHFSNGIIASFGNLLAIGEKEKLYDVFKKSVYIAFIMSNFAAVTLYCLFNDFISIWLGSEFLLKSEVVNIICVNLYIQLISEPIGGLRASAGLFKPDKYLHIALAFLNMCVAIILVNVIGIFGVFLGTFLCLCIKELTILPHIVYKNIFKKSVFLYQGKILLYSLTTAISGVATLFACQHIKSSNIYISFFIKAVICIIIPNIIALLAFCKTDEFKYVVALIKSIISKILEKKNKSGVVS